MINNPIHAGQYVEIATADFVPARDPGSRSPFWPGERVQIVGTLRGQSLVTDNAGRARWVEPHQIRELPRC